MHCNQWTEASTAHLEQLTLHRLCFSANGGECARWEDFSAAVTRLLVDTFKTFFIFSFLFCQLFSFFAVAKHTFWQRKSCIAYFFNFPSLLASFSFVHVPSLFSSRHKIPFYTDTTILFLCFFWSLHRQHPVIWCQIKTKQAKVMSVLCRPCFIRERQYFPFIPIWFLLSAPQYKKIHQTIHRSQTFPTHNRSISIHFNGVLKLFLLKEIFYLLFMHNCYVQLFHIFKKKKYFLRKGLKTVALIISVSVMAFVYLC